MRDNSSRSWRILSTYVGMTSQLSLKLFYYCPITSLTCTGPITAEINRAGDN